MFPATPVSSRTCSPEWARWTLRYWWWPRPKGGCPRAKSTSASSICSASNTRLVALTKADLVDDETLDDRAARGRGASGRHRVSPTRRSWCATRAPGAGWTRCARALDAVLRRAPPPVDRRTTAALGGPSVRGQGCGNRGDRHPDRRHDRGRRHHAGTRSRRPGSEASRVAAPRETSPRSALGSHSTWSAWITIELRRGDAVVRAGDWRPVDDRRHLVDGAPETPRSGADHDSRPRSDRASTDVWCRPLDDQFARLRFDQPVPLAPGDRLDTPGPGPLHDGRRRQVLDISPTRRPATHRPGSSAPGARLLAAGWTPIAELDARVGLPAAAAGREIRARSVAERIGEWFVRRRTRRRPRHASWRQWTESPSRLPRRNRATARRPGTRARDHRRQRRGTRRDAPGLDGRPGLRSAPRVTRLDRSSRPTRESHCSRRYGSRRSHHRRPRISPLLARWSARVAASRSTASTSRRPRSTLRASGSWMPSVSGHAHRRRRSGTCSVRPESTWCRS